MSRSEVKRPECFGSNPSRQQQAENDCHRCPHIGPCSVAGVRKQTEQVGGDHYDKMEIEPWDVWDTWPLEQRIGAYRGNALKYLMRMGTKDERLQEAKKLLHYAQKLVEVLKDD